MKLRLNNSNLLFLIILLYPIVYAFPFLFEQLGFNLNYIYFGVVQLLCATIYVSNGAVILRKKDWLLFILLILFLLIILYNFSGFNTISSILLISNSISIIFIFSRVSNPVHKDTVLLGIIIYFLVSILLIPDPTRYINMGRFNGFSQSSTTYAVYLTVAVIVYLELEKRKILSYSVYAIGFVFILMSQTRINLAFYTLLPVLRYFCNKRILHPRFIYIVAVSTLLAIYPIFILLQNTAFERALSARYESGQKDSSTALRVALSVKTLEMFTEGSPKNKLMGHGFGYARANVLDTFGADWKPHNDFLRVLVDFGIAGLGVLLFILYLVFKRNSLTIQLGLLYLITFYHNMIFDLLVVSLLFFFSNKSYSSKLIENSTFE